MEKQLMEELIDVVEKLERIIDELELTFRQKVILELVLKVAKLLLEREVREHG